MARKLTLGSLFDGSGGFPLGAALTGITPVWASEIEPFPIRVTEKRIPGMIHLGDISKLDGSKIPPVDIITFGSPCQDMSVAGPRNGLGGERSGLFYEAIRVIKEMRKATDGEYPRYIVWENVPGAFSSNKGQDFRSVIEEVCRVRYDEVSVPLSEKWQRAGLIVEDDFSLAWRLLDAQYWGVPQRRKRIYLVADFGGGRAGEILFDSECLQGDPAEGISEGEVSAEGAAGGSGETGAVCLNDQGGNRMDVSVGITSTLRAKANHPPLVFQNHAQGARYDGPLDAADTVVSRYGTGGNNVQLVIDTPKLLKIRMGHTGQGGRGPLIQDNKSATLSCNNDQTLFVPAAFGIGRDAFNQGANAKFGISIEEGIAPPMLSRGPGAVAAPAWSTSKSSFFTSASKEQAGALVATDYKDPPIVNDGNEETGYVVRRLTPTECARLQGFPDWWCSELGDDDPSDEEVAIWQERFKTYAKALGKEIKDKTANQIRKWLANPHSDSAEYKMWGNGVALPCVVYILNGIAKRSGDTEGKS